MISVTQWELIYQGRRRFLSESQQRVFATEEHDKMLKLLPIVWIQLERSLRRFPIVFTVSGRRQQVTA